MTSPHLDGGEVVDFVRRRQHVPPGCEQSLCHPSAYASRLFAQGVLGGKIHHQGPCKGWTAVSQHAICANIADLRMWWTPGYGRWLGVTATAHLEGDTSAVG